MDGGSQNPNSNSNYSNYNNYSNNSNYSNYSSNTSGYSNECPSEYWGLPLPTSLCEVRSGLPRKHKPRATTDLNSDKADALLVLPVPHQGLKVAVHRRNAVLCINQNMGAASASIMRIA